MKKFITNLFYFVIILLIINTVFYVITYQSYYKSYEKIDLTFESYLLADSHGTPLGVLTEKFDIYNFSAASDSYFDILIKVKYLIKNTKVKTIILSVDDHTLSPYREIINNLQRSSYYIIKEDYKTAFTGVANGFKKFIVLLNSSIRGIIRSYVQSALIKNTRNKDWVLLSDNKKSYLSIERFNYQFNFPIASKQLTSSLEEIINICKENSIELIGIQFPLTQVYFETIKNNSFHADKVFMKHNLKVYDFRELYQNQDDYFENQDHLNEKGSKEFVKELKQTLQIHLYTLSSISKRGQYPLC
ncbi:MAG: hypothetical protein L3J83_10130 [Proteobacteria bacterium]|nr:hypothetical protein [Pseudomonadota bacterium]